MSGIAITRRLAFVTRVERRVESAGAVLSFWDVKALEALRSGVDMLEVRARCQRAGFKLGRRHSYIAGVKRAFLVHTRAA